MKRVLTLSLMVLAIVCAITYAILAQKFGNSVQTNVANTEAVNPVINVVPNKVVEFKNNKGQLVKSISLKADTVAIGNDDNGTKERVTTYYGGAIGNKYCILKTVRFYHYKNTYGSLVDPDAGSWIEYYNANGKLLWKIKDAYYDNVSAAGNRVVVVVPIFSDEAKKGKFEDPKSEDPKYREYIVVLDTLGNEIYRYETKDINGFGFATDNAKYLWVHEIEKEGINTKIKTVYLSIETGGKYIVPDIFGSTYSIVLNAQGLITIKLRSKKQIEKIIKPDDWQ